VDSKTAQLLGPAQSAHTIRKFIR